MSNTRPLTRQNSKQQNRQDSGEVIFDGVGSSNQSNQSRVVHSPPSSTTVSSANSTMSVPPPTVPSIPSLVVTAGTPLQNRPPVRRSLGNNLATVPSTTSMVTTLTTTIVTTTPSTVTTTPVTTIHPPITTTTVSGLVRTNNSPAINLNAQINERINNNNLQASVDGVFVENPPPVHLPQIQPNAGFVSYPGTAPVSAQAEQGVSQTAITQLMSCIQNLTLALNSQRENTVQVPVQPNTQTVRTVTHSFGDGECGTGHLTQDTRAMTSSALPAYEQPGTSGTINVHRNLAEINNNTNNNSNIDPNANLNNYPIGNNNLNNNINVDNNINNNNYPIESQINNANNNNYLGVRNNSNLNNYHPMNNYGNNGVDNFDILGENLGTGGYHDRYLNHNGSERYQGFVEQPRANNLVLPDVAAVSLRKWRDIREIVRSWPVRYPQGDLSANSFLASFEAMAFREGWLITDLIKILGYIFVGKVNKWYDTYSRHWIDYDHFKREFLRAFGSHKTDTQLLMEIGQLRPEAGESSTDFVFRVQQKYGEMRNPPPESEQVTCIRNHLPRNLSTLVFSRLVNNYDDLLSVLHEAAVLLEENKRTLESSEKSSSKTKEKSRFSAVHTSPRNSILVDMMNGKQPLIIEEIREGEDGQFIVCASAATVQPPQQSFSSYRPQNNRARNSNNASNNGSFNVAPRSYSEVTAGRNLDQDFCHNCGQNGHTFDQCNNIRVDVCNFCFRAGHIKQNCFQANGGPPNNGFNQNFNSRRSNGPAQINYNNRNNYNNNSYVNRNNFNQNRGQSNFNNANRSNLNFIPGNFRVNDNRNDSGNQFHDNNRAISNSQGENNVNNNRNNNHSNCVEVQSTSAGDASYPQSSKN